MISRITGGELAFSHSVSRKGRKLLEFLDREYTLDPEVEGRTVITVDASSPDVLVDLSRAERVIVVDHHPDNTIEGEKILFHTPSLSENFVEYAEGKERFALAVGIYDDTYGLRTATADTLRTMAELVDEVHRVFDFLSDYPLSERLAVLKGMRRGVIHVVGDTVIVVTRVGSFEGVVASHLIDVGADIAIVYSKKRVTVRSRFPVKHVFDAAASLWNGNCGGHERAFTCVVPQEFVKNFIRSVIRYLGRGKERKVL